MAQRKTKCPKCGKPARKEKKLMKLTGRDKVSISWRVYVHREEVAMGFHIIHECCYVKESRPTPRAVDGGQAGENNGQVALPTATNA